MFEGSVGIFLDGWKIVVITFNSHRLVCVPRMNPNVHFPVTVCTRRNGFVGYHLEKRTIVNENTSNSFHIHHTWMSQEVSKWLVNGLSPTYKGLGVETERVPGVETERPMWGPLLRQGVGTERANVKNVTGVTGVSGKGWEPSRLMLMSQGAKVVPSVQGADCQVVPSIWMARQLNSWTQEGVGPRGRRCWYDREPSPAELRRDMWPNPCGAKKEARFWPAPVICRFFAHGCDTCFGKYIYGHSCGHIKQKLSC